MSGKVPRSHGLRQEPVRHKRDCPVAWGSWNPGPEEELGLPFQVVQKEEEGQQVGLWE